MKILQAQMEGYKKEIVAHLLKDSSSPPSTSVVSHVPPLQCASLMIEQERIARLESLIKAQFTLTSFTSNWTLLVTSTSYKQLLSLIHWKISLNNALLWIEERWYVPPTVFTRLSEFYVDHISVLLHSPRSACHWGRCYDEFDTSRLLPWPHLHFAS